MNESRGSLYGGTVRGIKELCLDEILESLICILEE